MWASFNFLELFSLISFGMNLFLIDTDFCISEVIKGSSLNLNLFLEGYKCKVQTQTSQRKVLYDSYCSYLTKTYDYIPVN